MMNHIRGCAMLGFLLCTLVLVCVSVTTTLAGESDPSNGADDRAQQSNAGTKVDTQGATGFHPDVLVVVGAEGTSEYGEQFRLWEERWKDLAENSKARYRVIGTDEEGTQDRSQSQGGATNAGKEGAPSNDRSLLIESLRLMNRETEEPLWLILIGHGTYTRGVAKFNLRGPDISGAELAEHLATFSRPLIALNFFSASGPFINAISGENRVVVSATKSGQEQNYSRFGGYFIESLGDLSSDLDHDQRVSVLEAFLSASSQTQAFYDSEQRLLTEHALVDDNGDKLGTPAVFFRGIRAVRKSKSSDSVDGRVSARASLGEEQGYAELTLTQRQFRDQQERALDDLVSRQASLSRAEYLLELEKILVPLAEIYAAEPDSDSNNDTVEDTTEQ